jgi:hypothetical protein
MDQYCDELGEELFVGEFAECFADVWDANDKRICTIFLKKMNVECWKGSVAGWLSMNTLTNFFQHLRHLKFFKT